jgi:hypothetical protein
MSDQMSHFLLAEAEKLTEKIKSRDGKPTPDEKARVEAYLTRVREIRDTAKLREHVEQTTTPAGGPGGGQSAGAKFVNLLGAAGWHLKANPSVEVSAYSAFKTTVPGPEEINPSRPGGVVAMGRDSRFLHPHLIQEDTGGATAVQDFKQTARSVSGDVERGLTATSEKARLSTTTELVTAPVRQFAVVIEDIPNAVLESAPQFRAYWDAEGRFQVDRALDAHVVAQIEAAGPTVGESGATLIEKIRNAVAAMRADGAEPDLLVLNPGDAAALDLSTDAGGFVFATRDSGTGSPLWGLRVVERAGVGNEPPYLLDTSTLGVLNLGWMRIDADPYSGFSRNLTSLRVEVDGLFHVRAPWAAYKVEDAT